MCLVPLMIQFNIFLFLGGGLCNLLEYFQEKNESKREKERVQVQTRAGGKGRKKRNSQEYKA